MLGAARRLATEPVVMRATATHEMYFALVATCEASRVATRPAGTSTAISHLRPGALASCSFDCLRPTLVWQRAYGDAMHWEQAPVRLTSRDDLELVSSLV